MESKIKAGIVGGAGYTGGELIRLLLQHPFVELSFVTSRKSAGKAISKIHKDLLGETEILFSEGIPENVDILFLCLPHQQSKVWLEQNHVPFETRIIDLSNDFRLEGHFRDRHFVYGLLELNKEAIQKANAIANPGCFASVLQYALMPLAHLQKLKEVYVTGITGSTGAGVQPSDTTHFSWRANNISAYKTLKHQHVKEVNRTLENLNKSSVSLHFVPWRGDFPRGIFISATLDCKEPLEEVYQIYDAFYKNEFFISVSKNCICLKQVVNTNKCIIQLEQEGDKLVIHAAIDNLLKGAAGQAVQNMNLLFGFHETSGLKLKPLAY